MTRRSERGSLEDALARNDDEKVRNAALSVGVAVAAASGALIFLACIVVIIVVVVNSVQFAPGTPQYINGRPVPRPRQGGLGYLNSNDVVFAVAIMAVLFLVLTSLVAWFMARRAVRPLADALSLQRHFIADASHELRTPLTALSSRVQILQRRLDSGKPIDDVVSQLRSDTTNMANVLDDMLLTVEGAPAADGIQTPVVASLHKAMTSLSPLAEQADIRLTLSATSDVLVAVPETSLTRAVVAVIDNAIQHSPAGSSVDVSVGVVEHEVVIWVADHGSGITGVAPDHVFDRFAHGAETGRKRSFGLGLALASEVAHRFGGEIRVESTSSQGTTFALSFPII